MEQTLISMVDFTLNVKDQCNNNQGLCYRQAVKFKRCEDYANFLKQPPKLGDFIPCDKEGDPLEKPEMNPRVFPLTNEQSLKINEYQEALERVKLEGFVIKDTNEYSVWIKNGSTDVVFDLNGKLLSHGIKTLEDLTGLTLKHKI